MSARAAQAPRGPRPGWPAACTTRSTSPSSPGWAGTRLSATFAPDRHHRLLGYRLCRVAGCGLRGLEPERAVRRLPRPLREGGEEGRP